MLVRSVTEEDMPVIFPWFEGRQWPYPPVEGLAPGLGFVAEKDGELLACAFAYLTGRAIAFVDWTATNPLVAPHVSTGALLQVIDEMKQILPKQVSPPVKAIVVFTQNEKLAAKFQKEKFKKASNYHRLLWTAKD